MIEKYDACQISICLQHLHDCNLLLGASSTQSGVSNPQSAVRVFYWPIKICKTPPEYACKTTIKFVDFVYLVSNHSLTVLINRRTSLCLNKTYLEAVHVAEYFHCVIGSFPCEWIKAITKTVTVQTHFCYGKTKIRRKVP